MEMNGSMDWRVNACREKTDITKKLSINCRKHKIGCKDEAAYVT